MSIISLNEDAWLHMTPIAPGTMYRPDSPITGTGAATAIDAVSELVVSTSEVGMALFWGRVGSIEVTLAFL